MLKHSIYYIKNSIEWWSVQNAVANCEGSDKYTLDIDRITGGYLHIYDIDVRSYIDEQVIGRITEYEIDELLYACSNIKL